MAANAPLTSSTPASEAFASNGAHANTNANTNAGTKLSTAASRAARPLIAGPPAPELLFPIVLHGAVQKGYGRGGKDLGCPTANLPDDALGPILSNGAKPRTGVYYGFAQVLSLRLSPPQPPSASLESNSSPKSATSITEEHSTISSNLQHDVDSGVYPMVMSVGWNPFYKNDRLSAEVHIMHEYLHDFYSYEMRVLILGYIRPEYDYTSREALIEDIETDKKVALRSLERPAYAAYINHEMFEPVRQTEATQPLATTSVDANGQESKL